MILGDLVLNRLPPLPFWGAGWVALWSTMFSAWSTIYYIRTGSFLYPFLDAHRPYAWIAYAGLYAGVAVAFAVAVWLLQVKEGTLVGRSKATRARRAPRKVT